MYQTRTIPLEGVQAAKDLIERIEEVWRDADVKVDESIRVDLFELVGLTKGLMLAVDSHVLASFQGEDEPA